MSIKWFIPSSLRTIFIILADYSYRLGKSQLLRWLRSLCLASSRGCPAKFKVGQPGEGRVLDLDTCIWSFRTEFVYPGCWHLDNGAGYQLDHWLSIRLLKPPPYFFVILGYLKVLDIWHPLDSIQPSTQGFYLNHVLPPRPSKSYSVDGTASYMMAHLATPMFSLLLPT